MVGRLCELCESCCLDLDGVSGSDAELRSEGDESLTKIGIAIELLAESIED